MRAGVGSAQNPCSIRILVRARMRPTAHPGPVWVLMRAGVSSAQNPYSIRILVRARMRPTAHPGPVWILVRPYVVAAAHPRSIGILLRGCVSAQIPDKHPIALLVAINGFYKYSVLTRMVPKQEPLIGRLSWTKNCCPKPFATSRPSNLCLCVCV
jgi:hypothetical protein